jgi:hypothetical protein
VIYCNPGDIFDDAVHEQVNQAKDSGSTKDLNEILRASNTWTVDS